MSATDPPATNVTVTAPPDTDIADAVPAYRDGNVLRWLAAYTASLVGDSVYFVALGWSAQQVAGAAEVGLIMAAGALPRALLMLGGGVVADRFGPRRVVIGSDAVRCVLILGVAAGIALTTPAAWLLVAVALVFGAVDALFVPAVGALPPRITSAGQLARVTGMRTLSMRLSQIAGPPIGGLAMAHGGTAATFTVAGLLFALSLPLLILVRLRPLTDHEETTPTTPTGRQDETAPMTPAGRQDETAPTTRTGRQDEAVPTTTTGRHDETAPATRTGRQDETASTTRTSRQDEAVPTTTTGRHDETAPATRTGRQDETAPATRTGPQHETAPATRRGRWGETAAARRTGWQELLDGLRYIRGHRLILPLVAVGAITELGLTGTLNVGLVLLNGERGWGPSGYGWIVSGFGTGATAGAALLTVARRLPRAGGVLSGTMLVCCTGAAMIGLVPTLPLAVVAATVVGLAAGVHGGVSNTLIQTSADPAYLGRVTSVVMLTVVGLAPLSYPLVGAAIGAWGATPVFVGCGVFAAFGVVITLVSGHVRRAELPR
ncbi:hypothetical protein GCM10009677_47870 [Sphaerisporangium rubeum]|uniref:MFS family permease n=1 Tax=Sphaerisporangium rubeum TaxID=321317 RepID=A0A7X0IHH6_9ACTN|nr:MFS family permease [Sphaerisporangium rubeum]